MLRFLAERATDVMMGIPSAVLDGFGVDDYAIAGRGVFIQQARACPVQCAEFKDSKKPGFFCEKVLKNHPIRGYLNNG